ncbi:uncharacterized protein LOC128670497 [Plodia interpunctella]|uniref:uncharacterized protein LOC128670497 n=1 Tax=Plodia interpunctella TaxID=58824 RepID=UPI00236894F3|nr:uncharacterized protein LOC128670497 [Plodia interpunctella]
MVQKSKMIEILLVICVNVVTILAAPLRSSAQELQAHLSPLQQQMLALQQMEMLNRMAANSPAFVNPTPVLLLLPNIPAIQNIHDIAVNPSEISAKEYLKHKTPTEKDSEDSVVIEAETENMITEKLRTRPILLLPNRSRFSIGGIISNIPWLPIEVNVPDSISWIYNGIAGIISGIGQRLPFKRPQNAEMTQDNNMKLLLKQYQMQQPSINILPIVIVPIDAPIVES